MPITDLLAGELVIVAHVQGKQVSHNEEHKEHSHGNNAQNHGNAQSSQTLIVAGGVTLPIMIAIVSAAKVPLAGNLTGTAAT